MKNQIFNYDFLIVGGGLIGSLIGMALHKLNHKVIIIEKNSQYFSDNRTLAVNANSREFLKTLGIWSILKKQPQEIKKIIIGDFFQSEKITFDNKKESMGSVIFNQDLQNILRNYLKKNNIFFKGVDFEKLNLSSLNTVKIKNKKYSFKKIILALGKNYNNPEYISKYQFASSHQAYVGFFNHQNNHQQIAYETFTSQGPLAVLPCPNKNKNLSTFIFSTKKKISKNNIKIFLDKYFNNTHGKIDINEEINNFPIIVHLSKPVKKNFILLGDSSRSIHPVAGQGWNLGVKDIQSFLNHIHYYSLEDNNFDEIYFAKRQIENIGYLLFTNSINYVYENDSFLSKSIIKNGFLLMNNISILRNIFIKQAMGRNI